MSSSRKLIALLASGLFALAAFPVFAASNDYLSGYAQGVLDARYAEFDVTASSATQAGAVTLTTRRCLRDEDIQLLTSAITRSGQVAQVAWNNACSEAATQVAGTKVPSQWLPDSKLFRPLQADPREPRLAIAFQEYETDDRDFTAADFHVGTTFDFYRGRLGNGSWQIGITGGVFSAVDHDAKNKDIFNVDYIIGLPFTYRNGDWSSRIRYYHSSSHLTDEFIFSNQLEFDDRLDISYDVVDFLLSHDWNQFRLYGGAGYIFRSTEDLDKTLGQAGLEYRNFNVFDNLGLSFAVDVKGRSELDWELAQSFQLALISRANKREVHYFLEYYTGPSPNGQFFFDEVDYYGLGIRFGL